MQCRQATQWRRGVAVGPSGFGFSEPEPALISRPAAKNKRRARSRSCAIERCGSNSQVRKNTNQTKPRINTASPVESQLKIGRTRLNSSHVAISYAVFCLKKKKTRADISCTYRVTHG